MKPKEQLAQQRYQKLEEIRRLGCDPYPHKYPVRHAIAELLKQFADTPAEELDRQALSVQSAGRLMTFRRHGKAGFCDLQAGGARIQVYVRQDRVGKENYHLFRQLDVGDIVGLRGVLSRTKTGELTIFCEHLDLLSKALLPLPEKWHGLSDVEIRYRQRYLDLLVNPRVREIFLARSRLIGELRHFLEERDYLEVETPMMQPLAGGAAARPFRTHHEALDMPLYLRIAPELYLKRLIVGGFERVFEINRNFRNEGISTQHNPEFTMLEFYQAYADYADLMELTEEMFRTVVPRVTGELEVDFGAERINFEHFRRFSMLEAIQEFWPGEPPRPQQLSEADALRKLLEGRGLEVSAQEDWGGLLQALFESVAEPHLVQPTFIHHFPAELSPLSKRDDEDPRFAERFEFFAGGLELANAYSELNDPAEQTRRFEEQRQARARGDQGAHEMDEDYIRALQYGMPPTAGEGIGIDRLTMVLTNSQSIREVILFPHLRPEA